MRDEDLLRRLQKLVALRDHPSTLPAIRDEAAKAYGKLRAKVGEPGPGQFRRPPFMAGTPDDDPVVRAMMREINRQMQDMVFPWDIHKPGR